MPEGICLPKWIRCKIMKLILASASPRRKELLAYLGYAFEVSVPSVDENILDGEDPETYVSRVSQAKCFAIFTQNQDAVVLSGDTSVVLDGRILGKPADKEEARNMMRALSGKTHQVYSAFSILAPGLSSPISRVVSTDVVFKTVSKEEIEQYIETSEPYDKAGGYAIQGIAGKFIPEIRGSVSSVIGLPLYEVDEALKKVISVSES